jgi:lipoprotein-releasing system permease protein
MGGFVENIRDRLFQFESHAILTPTGQAPVASSEVLSWAQGLSPHITQVTPFVRTDVVVRSTSALSLGALQGIDPKAEAQNPKGLSELLDPGANLGSLSHINETSYMTPSGEKRTVFLPGAFLGEDLAKTLGVGPGNVVTLVSPAVDEDLLPTQFPVVVMGIFTSQSSSLNKKFLFVSTETANRFLGRPDVWDGLRVNFQDPWQAPSTLHALKDQLAHQGWRAISWQESNPAFFLALELERWGVAVVLGLVIVVGCFSITISLLLSVRRRRYEMAILRSLGITHRGLEALCFLQGLYVGFWGICIGLATGFATLFLVSRYSIPGLTTAYSNAPLPVLVDGGTVVCLVVGTLILSLVAAVWPVLEVRKLNVVEVLALRN